MATNQKAASSPGGSNGPPSPWQLLKPSTRSVVRDQPQPTPNTVQATWDWIIFIVGAILCGLAFLAIEPWLLSPRGGFGPTVLQAARPVPAIVAMILALVVTFIISAGAGRLLRSPSKGLVIMGIGLGWLAWRLEGMESIAFSGSLTTVAIEGLIWTLVILLIAWGVYLYAGPLACVQPREDQSETDDWSTSPAAGILIASGLCALPIVWLIAQSPARGQAVAAAILGALAAGIVGRLVAPHIQPILLMMAPVLAGTLVQWAMTFWLAPNQLETLYMQGNFPHVLVPVPIDWVAGSLMGVPWGIYVGNIFLQHDADDGTKAEFA